MKATRNRPCVPVEGRLQAKLVENENGCLEFTGYLTPKGYGQIRVGGRSGGSHLTHRVAWELVNGPIEDGLFVCHKCDNPSCCNVDHLFLGSNADNVADMVAKGRHWAHGRTSCKRGHPFDDENTRINATTGSRFCHACHLETKRRYNARLRAA